MMTERGKYHNGNRFKIGGSAGAVKDLGYLL